MRYLARTDGPFLTDLATLFRDSFWRLEALARNGSAAAADAVCATSGPGTRDVWRDNMISHALAKHPAFSTDVAKQLREGNVGSDELEGVLNLAGEIGDPALYNALERVSG